MKPHLARAATCAAGVAGCLERAGSRDTLTDELRARAAEFRRRAEALQRDLERLEEDARLNRVELREAKTARRRAA